MENGSSMTADEIIAGVQAFSLPDGGIDVDAESLEPAGDRLFVEPLKLDQDTTAGGIVIPEQAKPKPVFGLVTKVGPGPWHDRATETAAPAAVGDVVLYGKFAGTEVEALGRTILVLRGTDVIAVQRKR